MYLSAQATMLPERHLPLMDSIGMSWETDPSKCSSLLKASLIAMCSGSLLALANTARGLLASWNQTTVTDRSPEPETSTSPPSNSSRLRFQSKLTILANQFSNLGLPFFLLESPLTEMLWPIRLGYCRGGRGVMLKLTSLLLGEPWCRT